MKVYWKGIRGVVSTTFAKAHPASLYLQVKYKLESLK